MRERLGGGCGARSERHSAVRTPAARSSTTSPEEAGRGWVPAQTLISSSERPFPCDGRLSPRGGFAWHIGHPLIPRTCGPNFIVGIAGVGVYR